MKQTKKQIIKQTDKLLTASAKKIAKLENPNTKIAIFGVGYTTQMYQKYFEKEGIAPLCYLDNSKTGGGVFSPTEFKSKYSEQDVLIIISSTYKDTCKAISLQLTELNLKHCCIDEYIFAKRKTEILKVLELLDEESAKVYAKMIECRIKMLPVPKEIVCDKQYFTIPAFLIPSEYEVFVDCGAFVGDTIEEFLFNKEGTFKRIFAFEPESKNYEALRKRVERLNAEWALDKSQITVIEAGVGAQQKTLRINGIATGHATSLSEFGTGDEVAVVTLDDYLKEESITFLKADIEGFELDMLEGAEDIIKRDKPKIAICIYHSASDMYQIVLYLARLNVGYKFAIRQHYFSFTDTILYAWVE